MKTRARSDAGFTLVEVVIALAILALTAIVLLDRRIEVVRDAGRSRDVRTAWVLATQKMGELELDKALWEGQGGQSSGDFAELGDAYARFTWEYLVVRVPVETVDPLTMTTPQKPKEIFRLGLKVDAEGLGEPILLEAMFPVPESRPKPAEAPVNPADPAAPGTPGPAAPPGPLPGPGGVKK